MEDKFVRGLFDNLNNYGIEENLSEVIIESYVSALRMSGWEDDDILRLLKQTADYFVDGVNRDCLLQSVIAIKINGGY